METGSRKMVGRKSWLGQIGRDGKRVQTFSYEVEKVWGSLHSLVTVLTVDNTVLYDWKLKRELKLNVLIYDDGCVN